MNCDEAFDALTNPKQSQSEALRRHLAQCPRCGQMQQVLEPALALLAPSEPGIDGAYGQSEDAGEWSPAGELRQAPALSPEALELAEQTAARLAGSQGRLRDRVRAGSVTLKYAAVFLIGCGAAWGAVLLQSSLNSADRSIPVAECSWQQRKEGRFMEEPSARAVTMSCVACHLPAGRK